MNIYLVTSNKNKLREAEHALKIRIKSVDLDLDEIQEIDAEKIAEHKAWQAWEKLKKPLFVWDQSIYIDCLNGFPGPLIKWFWTQVTLKKICEIANYFDNHKIQSGNILTYCDGKRIKHFSARMEGTIPKQPRGTKGWGWDSIFIPKGHKRTYAEMSMDEVVPLRSEATSLRKLRDFLKNNNTR